MKNSHRVFVYGTLKRGNRIRGLDSMGDAEFVGEAITTEARFTLYDLGAFPAASLTGHNRISGEVWAVNDQLFDLLDEIEGYPVFYSRDPISTTQGTAWIYHITDIDQYAADPVTGTDQPEGTVQWNPRQQTR